MARAGQLGDEEVQEALSNEAVVKALSNPKVQRAMQEASSTPGGLQHHMRDPEIRAAFAVLQRAGLVSFRP
jgi:uncharacterized protein YjgD (DUF1641 family)